MAAYAPELERKKDSASSVSKSGKAKVTQSILGDFLLGSNCLAALMLYDIDTSCNDAMCIDASSVGAMCIGASSIGTLCIGASSIGTLCIGAPCNDTFCIDVSYIDISIDTSMDTSSMDAFCIIAR